MQVVIPGLTRNPIFFWIPVFTGMTRYVVFMTLCIEEKIASSHTGCAHK